MGRVGVDKAPRNITSGICFLVSVLHNGFLHDRSILAEYFLLFDSDF